jgi:hypothetical protein
MTMRERPGDVGVSMLTKLSHAAQGGKPPSGMVYPFTAALNFLSKVLISMLAAKAACQA